MDKKILQKPVVTLSIGLVGLALIAAGIVLYPAKTNLLAQSTGCPATGGYPSAPIRPNSWRSNWKLSDWLMYKATGGDNLPIGAFGWNVLGKMTDSEGTISCFDERWRISKVIRAETRGPKKGQVISRASIESGAGDLRTAVADFDGKEKDSHFGRNENWDLVGQYGILRDSADQLSQSLSFFPVEWTVEGEIK